MKSDRLNKARNPLLPAAMAAIHRAAQRARQVARQTHTSIVVARAGKIERIASGEVREGAAGYRGESMPDRGEDDS